MKLIDFVKLFGDDVHITLISDDYTAEDFNSKLLIPVCYYDYFVDWFLPWGFMDIQINVKHNRNVR